MNRSSDMRNIMKLTENALLQPTVKSIKIDAPVYDLYRVLQAIADPEDYVNNSNIATSGLMLFNDDQEYERAVKVLKSMGIKYEDSGINNSNSTEEDQKTANNISPYANNGQVKNKKIYK